MSLHTPREHETLSYLPIADHALIGNQYTSAVVAHDGAIVWCCFPELPDASVFAALLDVRKGGSFRVYAEQSTVRAQRYVDGTAVLETIFETADGRLTLTDFMPMRGSIVGCREGATPPEIHRVLRCDAGHVAVQVRWSPRFDYARARTTIARAENGYVARAGDRVLGLAGLQRGEIVEGEHGPEARGSITLAQGEQVALVTRYGSTDTLVHVSESLRMQQETIDAWRDWMATAGSDDDFAWAGGHLDLLYRSAIVLKMLTHPRTGGIAAAPTTSLPEWIGGVRNWDYRYAWIRDASFTVQALLALGHAQEARDFVSFAERAAMNEEKSDHEVRLMYDLHGRLAPEEEELEHLEGYKESAPVRIGNGARLQIQHDVYGELIDCAYELVRRGEPLDADIYRFLAHLADRACDVWADPDDGIWEFRATPQHYTYSKVMVWVALDRAIRLAEQYGLAGDVERWRRSREQVREDVLAHGYDEEVGAFTIAYGSKELDAANLRIPLLEFLPCSDYRVQGTINRTLEQLTKQDLVYRYLLDDGLPGHEGAFGLCTFWMVDVLALSGRVGEARRIFEGLVRRINHVGLYSEEINPDGGAFLGNFPQAFTHLGLINSLLYLAAAEGRGHRGMPDLEGMPSMCGPGEVERGATSPVMAQKGPR